MRNAEFEFDINDQFMVDKEVQRALRRIFPEARSHWGVVHRKSSAVFAEAGMHDDWRRAEFAKEIMIYNIQSALRVTPDDTGTRKGLSKKSQQLSEATDAKIVWFGDKSRYKNDAGKRFVHGYNDNITHFERGR